MAQWWKFWAREQSQQTEAQRIQHEIARRVSEAKVKELAG